MLWYIVFFVNQFIIIYEEYCCIVHHIEYLQKNDDEIMEDP